VSRFARSYAQAFLGAAPRGYPADRFLETAGTIVAALRDPRARAFFGAPAVPAAARAGALAALSEKAGLDAYGTRFLAVVLENGRILHLPEILRTVREEIDRRGGVVAARVTVAAPIGEEERKQIEDSLSRQAGRSVRMSVDVDPAILGGLVAKIGSQVFDASVAQAVERFRQDAREKVGA